ncbi:unnamed protein product, partial [Owenia fusiformis]
DRYCSENRRCSPKKLNEDECVRPQECGSGFCTTGVCREECAVSADCPTDKYCNTDEAVCVDKLTTGTSCTANEQCIDKYCGTDDQKCGFCNTDFNCNFGATCLGKNDVNKIN